jgi:serine/threonine-protein kinase RIO1
MRRHLMVVALSKYIFVYILDLVKYNSHFSVYKTSILTFKDRDRYVTGEFRYRKGYCRHNPRKMVATWAEKEMRNLLRYLYKCEFELFLV